MCLEREQAHEPFALHNQHKPQAMLGSCDQRQEEIELRFDGGIPHEVFDEEVLVLLLHLQQPHLIVA